MTDKDNDLHQDDVSRLHKMGYAQELSRSMGHFSNFAISFSIICILSGGVNSIAQGISGAGGAALGIGWIVGGLAALIVLAVVTLVLPNFTITTSVGTYSRGQSIFAAVVSAALWGIFVFVQTVRHRDYFLPHDDHALPDEHAPPPSRRQAATSFVLLVVALAAVVGLAKVLSHPLEELVEAFHLPRGVVGIVIAMIVLLPDSFGPPITVRAGSKKTVVSL
jgi:Ca2+:H+ antiporter